MEIILAKTAGFCFGVDRAVKLTYDLLDKGCKVATLGPLIHNPQVVGDLEGKGALTCPDIDAVPDGYEGSSAATGCPAAYMKKLAHAAWRITMPPARSYQKSIKLPKKRAKTVRFCWWRGMPPTRKCRE